MAQNPRFFRLWQAAAIVFFICFLVITGLFIWVTEDRRDENNCKPSVDNDKEESKLKDIPCPRQPPLLDLPDPLPNHVVHALEKLDSHLKSLVNPTLQTPAISANVFYKGKVIWSEQYGSRQAQKSDTPDNDNLSHRKCYEDIPCSPAVQAFRTRCDFIGG